MAQGPESEDELAFLTRIPALSGAAEICHEVGRSALRLGMPTFAIFGVMDPSAPGLPAFRHHNWPAAWVERYERDGLALINPLPRIMAASDRTLTMTEILSGRAGFVPGPETAPFFAELARIGRRAGLLAPIHGPRGPRGAALFNGPGPEPGLRARGILGLLGHVAFARLSDIEGYRPGSAIHLTRREVEALSAYAAGLGDAAIAASMGGAVRTVRFHLENTRRKLGARSRAEALAIALRNGLLAR